MKLEYFDLLRNVLSLNMATNYCSEDYLIKYLNEEYEFELFNEKLERELIETIISISNVELQKGIIKYYLIEMEKYFSFYSNWRPYERITEIENIDLYFLEIRGIRIGGYLDSIKKVCLLFNLDYDSIVSGLGFNFENFHLDSTPLESNIRKFLPMKGTQMTMLIHELDIFEHLKKSFPELNNNDTKLAKIVSSFTGINKDTIRQSYRAIIGISPNKKNNPYNNITNEEFIYNKFSEFGIRRKKEKGEK